MSYMRESIDSVDLFEGSTQRTGEQIEFGFFFSTHKITVQNNINELPKYQ